MITNSTMAFNIMTLHNDIQNINCIMTFGKMTFSPDNTFDNGILHDNTQHNGIQHNDTLHNDIQHINSIMTFSPDNTLYNDILHDNT